MERCTADSRSADAHGGIAEAVGQPLQPPFLLDARNLVQRLDDPLRAALYENALPYGLACPAEAQGREVQGISARVHGRQRAPEEAPCRAAPRPAIRGLLALGLLCRVPDALEHFVRCAQLQVRELDAERLDLVVVLLGPFADPRYVAFARDVARDLKVLAALVLIVKGREALCVQAVIVRQLPYEARRIGHACVPQRLRLLVVQFGHMVLDTEL